MRKRIFYAILCMLIVALLLFLSQGTVSANPEPEYHPYSEVISDMESIAVNNPDIVTLHNLSEEYSAPLTHQNRSLLALRITDHDADENEPEVLLTGCHHPREWISVEVPLYFIHYLVDNYGTDPYVTYLVENRDIWIIPVVNPDGYIKSWEQNDREHNWTGWRKNCRDNNGDGVIDNKDGVDLNRNYGYEWGYDDSGSSPDLASNYYRGPSSFSEPETQAVRNLSLLHDFRVSIHYHSHGELNLYPWAYEDLDTGDHETFVMMGQQMTDYNGYIHDNCNNSEIYNCNGEASDWFYGELESFAFTIELGSSNDRFIPDESRIIPICEENLQVNLFACLAADMPESMIFQNDPEESSASSSTWGYSGTGGNWTIIDEGIIGDHCWHMETEGMENTSAELRLNLSLTSSKGNRYLTLWNKYDISAGAELKICLIDESGNYELIEKIGSEVGQRRFRGPQDSGWGMSVYNLTPFLEETEGKKISFILESDSGETGDYWDIDAVRITSKYPEASGNITLRGKPRAHIDDISPNLALDTETVSFKGHGTDDGTIERYVWHSSINGELYNGTNDSFSKNNLSNGTHTIFLKVQDNNGVWSGEVSSTLVVNGKPRAKIESISPNPVLEGKEVTFTGSGTDDGTIERYLWMSSSEELYNGTETTFMLSNLVIGTHVIKLQVLDNDGACSDEINVSLEIKPDADGDGVTDSEDAFPDDAAASKDNDEDGHPDEWNEGKTEKDSTTDLKLDEYPNDPKKWKKEEGGGGEFIPGSDAVVLAGALLIGAVLASGNGRSPNNRVKRILRFIWPFQLYNWVFVR